MQLRPIQTLQVVINLASDASGRLQGMRVVITRAESQNSELSAMLRREGAHVFEVPTITILDPDDGGEELGRALADIARYDWLVVTSANGAERVGRSLEGRVLGRVRVAAVGSSSAAVMHRHGVNVDLIPERFIAESLLESFPAPDPTTGDRGRVLLARAAEGRDVLPNGLQDLGWTVDVVAAYQTVPLVLRPSQVAEVLSADVVMFTSPSTVRALVESVDSGGLPATVVCIGPVTADAARRCGVGVDVIAEPHTVTGLVNGLINHIAGHSAGDT